MIKLGVWLLILLILTGCSSDKPKAGESVRPVKAITIQSSPVTTEYSYAGIVTARDEIPMSFQVTGKLASRLVDVGDKVKKGQLLATLDANDLNIQLEIKEQKLIAAKSNLEFADSELKRYSPLLKKGYVTPSQVNQLKSKYDSALADWNNANKDLVAAQRQLSYTNLYSQIDGIVVDTSASTGEVLEAGKPVLKIATSDEKEITINVPEQRVQQWKKSPGVIEVALWANSEKKYKVHVREISSDTDPVTRTFTVKLGVVDPGTDMLLGMTANVKLRFVNQSPKVSIPITSLFYQEKTPQVWVIDPHKLTVKATAVMLGQYSKNNTVLVDKGLHDGEMIVTAGAHNLFPGQKISLLGTDE